ncbi:adenosylcobinamide-GDP ribazoletransferase [Desulforamulus hydrothermalis]|uniref:Adenosylcobinamide-GDP ribazoletransferase n=1 Tax=Desulforamulus hydrothermalis Lam5 = DSM 18033 TaxID=1121428 RepID=K8DYK0_9FIRM|nr:adenosylcobinamide-GDP ribazoletransferase [Desulforamulus hydrothermalis]CCO07972.1 Cobalamin synthase [Desulforamulus hydrothermalis Lam5 = DSM 18033]SHG85063.1 cobalamin-5'-phosphate synthase [Desulforamulus hydrothermalis Lam5 = DSM 18033]
MLTGFRLAVSFLTIIPLYKKMAKNQELARSVSYYPLVGLLLGAAAAGLCVLLQRLGLTLGADALALAALIFLTGGLHLDGLMDTADGLLSGRDRSKKLEIMKDSRVGAMGVIAFGTMLLLKLSFLYELNSSLKITALLLAPAAGRWAMVYSIVRHPYARASGGLGAVLQGAGYAQLALASMFFAAAAFWLAGWPGVLITVTAALTAGVCTALIVKSLGGMTGDTYGATGEMVETWTFLIILLGQQAGLL